MQIYHVWKMEGQIISPKGAKQIYPIPELFSCVLALLHILCLLNSSNS